MIRSSGLYNAANYRADKVKCGRVQQLVIDLSDSDDESDAEDQEFQRKTSCRRDTIDYPLTSIPGSSAVTNQSLTNQKQSSFLPNSTSPSVSPDHLALCQLTLNSGKNNNSSSIDSCCDTSSLTSSTLFSGLSRQISESPPPLYHRSRNELITSETQTSPHFQTGYVPVSNNEPFKSVWYGGRGRGGSSHKSKAANQRRMIYLESCDDN